MPSIYLVTGIMASGKSTIGELLAHRFEKGVHLRGDLFRRMIVSGREEMTGDLSPEAMKQLLLRYELAGCCAERYCQAGFDVVWQDVIVGKVLPEAVALIKSRPLHVIVLCPDPAIVAQREAGRGKTGYGRGFTPQNFDSLLRSETPPIGTWIDSTHLTPEQTVDEILLRTGGKTEGMY